jgi:peptidoglycan DL-endopeptidase CwlO
MKVLQKRVLVMSTMGVLLLEITAFPNVVKANNVLNNSVVEYNYSTEDIEKLLEDNYRLQDISLSFNSAALVEEALKLEQEADEETAKREAEAREIEEEETKIVIAQVNNYLNIRKKPSEDSKVVGKLYNNGVGTIIKEKDGWFKITSGSVTGYVKADYVLTGDKAQKKADEVGDRLAIVTTTTLKVREKAKKDATVLTLVGEDEVLPVKKETKNWVKIKTDDYSGYVSKDYVDLYTENEQAESIKEERARLKREEARRQELLAQQQRLAQQQLLAQQQAASNNSQAHTSSNSSSTTNNSSTNHNSTNNSSTNNTSTTNNSTSNSSNSTSSNSSSTVGSSSQTSSSTNTPPGNKSLGQQIANYAVQFKGNPYVYGGTSLTNGADCSGFVLSVFRKFGISLPRTSGAQATVGRRVASISEAQPGDLIAYTGHIGIYIGSGKIIHASSPKTGIIISNVNYRPIKSIRRVV